MNLNDLEIPDSPRQELLFNQRGSNIDIFGKKRGSVPIKGAHQVEEVTDTNQPSMRSLLSDPFHQFNSSKASPRKK